MAKFNQWKIKKLKSGKVILSIDIYDGTSTMTCKAFLPGKNAKKIVKRIKGTKAIKLAGRAQMDTFSNELTSNGKYNSCNQNHYQKQ